MRACNSTYSLCVKLVHLCLDCPIPTFLRDQQYVSTFYSRAHTYKFLHIHRLALSTNIGIFSLIFSISTAVVEFSCDAAIPSDFSDCYQIPLWRPLLYLMLGFALLHTMLPNFMLLEQCTLEEHSMQDLCFQWEGTMGQLCTKALG